MAKKKLASAAEQAIPPDAQDACNGDARRPAQSWAVSSDRATRVEVACRLQTYTNARNEPYKHASFTVQRSYRTEQDGWQKGGPWRAHDIPVLVFLLQKAHAWALDRRTADSSIPF